MNKELLLEQINQGLSTWKLAEYFNTTQPNIRYWLKKFNLQTIRKQNSNSKQRICLTCNETKHQTDFYLQSGKYKSHCKSCYLKNNTLRRTFIKQQCVDYLGGSCLNCGYNKCLSALEFHHLDPTTKDKDYTNNRLSSFEKLKPELDKCILLCANCHREDHSSIRDI